MAMLCGSFPAAEDAVQEALARAWERSERGERVESLAAWVTVVARNLLRDRLRRIVVERRARHRLAQPPEGPVFASIEQRADIVRALSGLSRRQREVAIFHYYLDLEVAEIARSLNVPEGTVKSALFRARRALAAELSDDEEMEVGDVTS